MELQRAGDTAGRVDRVYGGIGIGVTQYMHCIRDGVVHGALQ